MSARTILKHVYENGGMTEYQYKRIDRVLKERERPHGECKTCKNYRPYMEQFSYKPRGDGYCKKPVTTPEGVTYMNCHDEWYCANYEKEGEENG